MRVQAVSVPGGEVSFVGVAFFAAAFFAGADFLAAAFFLAGAFFSTGASAFAGSITVSSTMGPGVKVDMSTLVAAAAEK